MNHQDFWTEWRSIIDSIEQSRFPLAEYQTARRRLQLLKLELPRAETSNAAAGLAMLDDIWRELLSTPNKDHLQATDESASPKANALLTSALTAEGNLETRLAVAQAAYQQIRELCQTASTSQRGIVARMMFPLARHIQNLEGLCKPES
ncbi:MAG: hypothetical protein ACREP9_22080 [Candidatus Dormibacteraceae bacterium]